MEPLKTTRIAQLVGIAVALLVRRRQAEAGHTPLPLLLRHCQRVNHGLNQADLHLELHQRYNNALLQYHITKKASTHTKYETITKVMGNHTEVLYMYIQ